MKFTCEQSLLSKALNTVTKAVSSKTTINILKGILLNITEDGYLVLTATDLDISIEKRIKVENFEPGSTVVLAKLFGDIIRRFPNSVVSFEEISDGNIIVKCAGSEFKIVGLPSDEFPSIGEIEGASDEISLDKEVLKDMIRKTSFCASIDESKGIIVGVLLELKNENFNMVALDGFRMAVNKRKTENNKERNIIIAAKNLNDVYKIISDIEEEESLNITVSSKKAIISSEEIKIVIRLLEGEFIKYSSIIPADHKCRISAEKNELLDSIERASLLAKEGKNNLIRMSIKDDGMVITSKSEEGNVRETVYIEKDGIDIEIGFNSKYIIDVLKVIDDEKIYMDFISSTSPCIIRSVEEDKYEYLILPVRISSVN